MIKVKLICPKCFKEKEWAGSDFEDVVDCECGYSNEAWYFWHTPLPLKRIKIYSHECIVYSRGAHYPNDALELKRKDFMEYFLGGGEMWHGGTFYAWVFQNFYGEGNPNNGTTDAEVRVNVWNSDKVERAKEFLDEVKGFMEYLEKKRK
jgi:hypothetical protein